MASAYALIVINRLLKDIMENNVFIGGKVIVLGGDFRQVLPVVPHGSRQLTIQNCIKIIHSPIWQLFKILKLFRNMQVNPNEIEFSKFLLPTSCKW